MQTYPGVLSSETSATIQRAQTVLIEFLRIDISVGFSLLHVARTSRDPKNRDHAGVAVHRALTMIRSLLRRVHDPSERARIECEADGLEHAMMRTVVIAVSVTGPAE